MASGVARARSNWHNIGMNRFETPPALADSQAQGNPGFGVYVHWPFCLAKCPYCDFNSHVRAEKIDEDRFVAAFRTEIAHRAAQTPGRNVRSIFFGGGTPSLMRPQTVQAIIDAVAARWSVEPDAEITLEANPTSVEAGRFRGYRAAGVNRVSIGVQSLDRRRSEGARAPAHRRRGDRGGEDRRLDLSAHVVRPDLRPPRPERGGLARRTDRGDEARGRACLALPADHRAGHDFRAAVARRQARHARRRTRARAVRRDAGNHRGAWPAGLRGLQPRAARRGEPAQSDLLALRRICRRRPGRAWARRRSARPGARRRPKNIRKCGSPRSRARATA